MEFLEFKFKRKISPARLIRIKPKKSTKSTIPKFLVKKPVPNNKCKLKNISNPIKSVTSPITMLREAEERLSKL